MDFTLPIGNAGDNPSTSPGGYNNFRNVAKSFWEFVENGINVSAFGAVGDGVTNDTESIASAMAYCRTNNQPLYFEHKEYLINDTINITDVHINGGGATIISTIEAPTGISGGKDVLKATGTADSFYNLDASGNIGDSFIKVSDATFLASLSAGDLIHIKSNAVYYTGSNYGEIHKVDAIESWGVVFRDHLFLNYSTTDTARVAKINSSKGSVVNLKIFNTRTNEQERISGIGYVYADKPYINNIELHNCYMEGVYIQNSWMPFVTNFAITDNRRDNYGYGVSIGSATMYAYIVNGIVHGSRHCFASGGGTDGIPWELVVQNVTGTIGHAGGGTCFDAHSSVGSIKFINCHAISGNHNFINDYTLYNAATTYAIDAKVSSSDGYLYHSLANGNVGNPLTDLTKWIPSTGNLNNGFNSRGQNVQIIDCKATRMFRGIVGVADTTDRFYLDRFQTFDCDYPIIINTTIIKDLTVKEIVCNSVKQRKTYAIIITGAFERSKISDITVNNQSVISYNNTTSSEVIELSNISGICGTNYVGSVGISVSTGVDKLKISAKLKGYDVPVNINSTVSNIDIDLTAEDFLNYAVQCGTTDNIMVRGKLYDSRGVGHVVYFTDNVANIFIPYLSYKGVQDFYLIRTVAAKTIGNLQYGNIQSSGGSYLGDFVAGLTNPSIIILSGSTKDIRDCIVVATPEASVTANIGAIARDRVNGKIYFKASGASNTGWLELDTV